MKTRNREEIAQRRSEAYRLRVAGLSLRAIAARLNISHTQARRDVEGAFREWQSIELADRATLVALESERLDLARLSLAPRVAKGDLGAVDRWIRISESYRRLHGLDAPMKIAPTTPDGSAPFEEKEEKPDIEERLLKIESVLAKARERRAAEKIPRDAEPPQEASFTAWGHAGNRSFSTRHKRRE